MRAPHPTHESAYFAIDQRAKHEVIMVGHQWVAAEVNLVELERLGQDALKRLVVASLVKYSRPGVSAIEDVVKPPGFIGPWCS